MKALILMALGFCLGIALENFLHAIKPSTSGHKVEDYIATNTNGISATVEMSAYESEVKQRFSTLTHSSAEFGWRARNDNWTLEQLHEAISAIERGEVSNGR